MDEVRGLEPLGDASLPTHFRPLDVSEMINNMCSFKSLTSWSFVATAQEMNVLRKISSQIQY